MQRRHFNAQLTHSVAALAAWAIGGALQHAHALSLSELSEQEAGKGLKAALEKGALAAVSSLGRSGGFLDNPRVRISLPGHLEDAAGLLRMAGQGKQVDELITGMNRAAEAAVPMGRDLLVKAVKSMTVQDAKQILTGGDNAVTQFFADKTREPLHRSFLPVVTQAVSRLGLARSYNRVAGKVAGLGLIKPEEATVEQHVTARTLDGLYTLIAEEERKIRQDPVGAGSKLIERVFGAVK